MDTKNLPLAESLQDTVDRLLSYWFNTIAPVIRSGKRVLVVAHGNSLRALIKYLNNPLYVLHNILYAGMSYPIGALADRIGKRGLLALGYVLAAIMGIGWIIAVPSVWMLALLFALGGTFIAAEDALEGALAADLLPEEVRGTGYGVLATVNGLGDFLSSIIVGALWTVFNPAVGFAYATLLFALGAIVIYRVR